METKRRRRADPPPLVADPVIDAFKKGIDLTLIRENLRHTPEERVRDLTELGRFMEALQRQMREVTRGH